MEDFQIAELLKNIKISTLLSIKEVSKVLESVISDDLSGKNNRIIDYKL